MQFLKWFQAGYCCVYFQTPKQTFNKMIHVKIKLFLKSRREFQHFALIYAVLSNLLNKGEDCKVSLTHGATIFKIMGNVTTADI